MILLCTINRFAYKLEASSKSEQRFRMPYEEITVPIEQFSKTVTQLPLRGSIKVDYHVPAEDDIEGPCHGPSMQQI
jgi:hypothetical protein